ncbi:MAG: S26 family signal peptidase [Treponema sp.]|jgi:signal peptidase I|nr:S26 family signal peptidase [Treponema sp.]
MKTDAPVSTGRIVLFAFLTALIMKVFLFDFMIADGRSMVPAIYPGTVLVVNRLAYGIRLPWIRKYLLRWSLPKAGDVVVFLTPQGQLAVKRCGMVMGKEQFFALGDNSLESYDSRSYGPISADRVMGKVMGIK